MGRKRRKKKIEEPTPSVSVSNIIIGIFMIMFGIIGMIPNGGTVGKWIKIISVNIFGRWYYLLLILLILFGAVILVKRKANKYFSRRVVGIALLVVSILIYTHIGFIRANNVESGNIISVTQTKLSLVSKVDVLLDDTINGTGGGFVAALICQALYSLFGAVGTVITAIMFDILSIVLIFDIEFSEVFERIGSLFRHDGEDDEDDEEDEDTKKEIKELEEQKQLTVGDMKNNELEDKKVIITSLSDLNKDIEESPVPAEVQDDTPGVYVKPPISLLDKPKQNKAEANSNDKINENISTLQQVFADFDMTAKVVEVHSGPSVTQYEMNLSKGTRVNKVLGISREIALAMSAKEVRIEAPIPGKNTIGVEIPNQNIIAVSMYEIMASKEVMGNTKDKLLAPLGKDIMGNVKYMKINKTPHMLVAGATGSGKSVCINNIIVSILMRTTPEEVKMVLVDPKKVEFNVYEGIPHLLTPVVTDPKKASAALQKIVVEMDDRYETFKNSGTKKIEDYNDWVDKQLEKDPNCGLKRMPFILVIIDELADLMLVAAKEVEESIMRITQLARAAGIHLIVATQRPSADVITGVVKANIPTRVSFAVSSSIDSRTILDMTGAEKLLGRGDMLYKPMDDNNPTRIQGSYVSDEEIKRVVDFVKKRSTGPRYSDKFSNLDQSSSGSDAGGGSSNIASDGLPKDVLYNEILEYAVRMGQISASLIQRKYSIGYNRAARIIDQFEEAGIVGPAKGSKPRDVLVKLEAPSEDIPPEE